MKNFLDEELLIRSIEKIDIYRNDENSQLTSIKRIIDGINYGYNSENNKKLADLSLLISNKFNVIKNIHSTDVYVLKKNIEKYKATTKEVETKFNNIK